MDNYTEQLEILEVRLQKAKEAKIKAETEKKSAKARLSELEVEMEKLGVTPETLNSKIEELEKSLTDGIAELEKKIPVV